MCKNCVFFSSDLYRAYACIFNSRGICAKMALVVLTHKEVLVVRSTRENNLLRSVLVAQGGAFSVFLTYEEVSNGVY